MKAEKTTSSLVQARAAVIAGQTSLKRRRAAESQTEAKYRAAKKEVKEARLLQKRTKAAYRDAKDVSRQSARTLEKAMGRLAKLQGKKGVAKKNLKPTSSGKPAKAK
jgi:hypothetical protein